VQALASKHRGGELDEFAAAQALLTAERALAAARSEPHAVPIEFPCNAALALRFLICSRTVVEFKRCICTKMGTPNDEVFRGHTLNGKGFQGYCPLRVKNSLWNQGTAGAAGFEPPHRRIKICPDPEQYQRSSERPCSLHFSTAAASRQNQLRGSCENTDGPYARCGSNIRIAASVTQKTRTERVPLTGIALL
jgi:hypothetical protein